MSGEPSNNVVLAGATGTKPPRYVFSLDSDGFFIIVGQSTGNGGPKATPPDLSPSYRATYLRDKEERLKAM
jgi:hypothetical protein